MEFEIGFLGLIFPSAQRLGMWVFTNKPLPDKSTQKDLKWASVPHQGSQQAPSHPVSRVSGEETHGCFSSGRAGSTLSPSLWSARAGFRIFWVQLFCRWCCLSGSSLTEGRSEPSNWTGRKTPFNIRGHWDDPGTPQRKEPVCLILGKQLSSSFNLS